MSKLRTCRICHASHPETKEFFYGKRNGLDNRCKNCMSLEGKKLYYKNIESEREKSRLRKRNSTEHQKNRTRELTRMWCKTPTGILNVYKRNARKRNIEFSLLKNDFINLIGKTCVYCGKLSRGVDRVDNTQGYTKENSVSCCNVCNKMKLEMTVKEFIDRCKLIIKINKK
jgi:hypothetical protein